MWHYLTDMPKKLSPVATPLAQYSSHPGNTTPVSGRVAGIINRQDVELTETKKPDNHSNIRLHCTAQEYTGLLKIVSLALCLKPCVCGKKR